MTIAKPDRLSGRTERLPPTTFLPADGFDGPFPDPPSSLPAELVEEYEALWRSPMAASWTFEEGRIVAQYVAIRRAVDDVLARAEFPPGTAMSRMTSIEDRLLLSPKARAMAHVRFVDSSSSVGDDDFEEWYAERLGESSEATS